MTLDDNWTPKTFKVQTPDGIADRAGHTYNGIGVFHDPQGFWVVVHLNTGLVSQFLGDTPRYREALTDLAQCVDWGFTRDGGWQNSQPDYVERIQAWRDRYGFAKQPVTDRTPPERKDEAARRIWLERE